jgi:hypothetical protein
MMTLVEKRILHPESFNSDALVAEKVDKMDCILAVVAQLIDVHMVMIGEITTS